MFGPYFGRYYPDSYYPPGSAVVVPPVVVAAPRTRRPVRVPFTIAPRPQFIPALPPRPVYLVDDLLIVFTITTVPPQTAIALSDAEVFPGPRFYSKLSAARSLTAAASFAAAVESSPLLRGEAALSAALEEAWTAEAERRLRQKEDEWLLLGV